MNIVQLPQQLLKSTPFDPDKVIFYHHVGHDSNYRSKITFNTNCITLLISGKKHVVVGDQEVFYENNSCLLFKTGNYLSTEISSTGKPYHSLLIFFGENVLREFKHKYSHLLTQDENHVPEKSYLYFSSDDYIESFKITASQAMEEKGVYSSSLHTIKFEEIMLYLLERHGRIIIDFLDTSVSYRNITAFKTIVEANALTNITVDELAFLCGMSKSTFKRTFLEVYGKSPGQWQMEKRLDHSAFLLQVKKKNPSEVYEEVGFANLSSFIQSFKKKFGRTPKQYQLH